MTEAVVVVDGDGDGDDGDGDFLLASGAARVSEVARTFATRKIANARNRQGLATEVLHGSDF